MRRRPSLARALAVAGALALIALAAGRADDGPQTADDLREKARALAGQIVKTRRHLHANPELSNREEQTSAWVAERLRAIGVDEVARGIAGHGVVAFIHGTRAPAGAEGPLVAARADMDALPVAERGEAEYKSRNEGVMHACGHDAHTACLLGVAELLVSVKDRFPGTVMLVFQPAEEGPPEGEEGGAKLMVKQGLFTEATGGRKPEAMFALHCSPDLPVGKIGYSVGTAFASVDRVRIAIKGKQSHAAYPWLGVDPVVVASQAVLALQTIRSRELDVRQPAVVSFGVIEGGTRWNIIPDQVELAGTVRTHDERVRASIRKSIERILDGVTRAAGARYEILEYTDMTPVCVNDPALSEKAAARLRAALGESNVLEVEASMGGEDFAYFAQIVPSFYFRLGVRRPDAEDWPGLHTPDFDIDEACLPVGVEAMARLILGSLERE